MEIKVLGAGCDRCAQLYSRTTEAVDAAGMDVPVQKVEQLDRIAAHGVFITPALVIDGDVACAGKVPRVEQITAWLRERGG